MKSFLYLLPLTFLIACADSGKRAIQQANAELNKMEVELKSATWDGKGNSHSGQFDTKLGEIRMDCRGSNDLKKSLKIKETGSSLRQICVQNDSQFKCSLEGDKSQEGLIKNDGSFVVLSTMEASEEGGAKIQSRNGIRGKFENENKISGNFYYHLVAKAGKKTISCAISYPFTSNRVGATTPATSKASTEGEAKLSYNLNGASGERVFESLSSRIGRDQSTEIGAKNSAGETLSIRLDRDQTIVSAKLTDDQNRPTILNESTNCKRTESEERKTREIRLQCPTLQASVVLK